MIQSTSLWCLSRHTGGAQSVEKFENSCSHIKITKKFQFKSVIFFVGLLNTDLLHTFIYEHKFVLWFLWTIKKTYRHYRNLRNFMESYRHLHSSNHKRHLLTLTFTNIKDTYGHFWTLKHKRNLLTLSLSNLRDL